MRSTRWLAAALVLALAAPSAADLAPLPAQPAGVAWPTDAWPTGPLPDDLDRAAFDAGVEALFGSVGRGGTPDTRALLVVQGGRLVYERYAEGFGPESRFQSWSMAKSVTNAFAGVLVHQGRLALDAPAPVERWSAPDDPRREITLRHMLQMRTGLANADGFGENADMLHAFVSKLLFGEGSRAPAAFAADVPLAHPVGEHWAYSTGTSMLIASLCGDAVGEGSSDTRDFLRREVFGPIGMESAQPEFAPSGEFLGGAFVHATARDWARLGQLYLREGVWNGRRMLPEGWVDFTRTPSPAANNTIHGAHFWVNRPPVDGQWEVLPGAPESTFAAEGAQFQMVAIVPTKDLVAVRLGESQGTEFPAIKEPFGPLISAFADRGAE